MMIPAEITEQELEAAEKLSSQREFDASLALLEKMLARVQDDQIRMRILFDIVTCSTWLNRKETLDKAIEELKHLSDYDVSHTFVVMARARACLDFGDAQEALDLINTNLGSEVLQRDEFVEFKYEHLFLKGRSLVQLGRYDEALSAFDAAHAIDPDGKCETDMLIDRSTCLMATARYGEAYDTASKVLPRGDEEMATLAMQYMAECRMWQLRVPEALELYAAIEKRLPSRLVDEERIRKGIANATTYLERGRPQGKPS